MKTETNSSISESFGIKLFFLLSRFLGMTSFKFKSSIYDIHMEGQLRFEKKISFNSGQMWTSTHTNYIYIHA